jgi:molecular chaperone IbpA
MNKSFIPSFFSQDVFKDFDKVFVGFDDQFKRMQALHDDLTKDIPNYPPFNVRKNGNTYTIEIAVAGFSQNEIDITIDGGKLIVKGNAESKEPEENFLFKGISNRAFTRAWAIGDQYEVKDAELFNGVLKIALDQLVPEDKKPKKVPVKTGTNKESAYDKAAESL